MICLVFHRLIEERLNKVIRLNFQNPTPKREEVGKRNVDSKNGILFYSKSL